MSELQEIVVWCSALFAAVLLSSSITAATFWLIAFAAVPAHTVLLLLGANLLAGAGITYSIAKAVGFVTSAVRRD